MGFLTLLTRINELWKERPDDIRKDAESLTGMVKTELDGRLPAPLTELNIMKSGATLWPLPVTSPKEG